MHFLFFFRIDLLKRYRQNTAQMMKNLEISGLKKIVSEKAKWYHCVALCEFFRMHFLFFFRIDLLKRYRGNTAEKWALLWGLMFVYPIDQYWRVVNNRR